MDWDRTADQDRMKVELAMDEGSLRDIVIQDTDVADWQRVLDLVRGWTPPPSLSFDQQPATLPERVEEIFRRRSLRQDALLSLKLGGGSANCHFFDEDEIEFDIDPREIIDPADVDAVTRFMTMLGEAIGKPVLLTAESAHEYVVLRWSPDTRTVEWPTGGDPPVGAGNG